MALDLYTPDSYRFITDPAQYYNQASPLANWKVRTYINWRNQNGVYNLSEEAAANDIEYANPSIRNPIHTTAGANGTKTDIGYTYIPFIMENTYLQDIYNVGIQFYTDVGGRDAQPGIKFSLGELQYQDADFGGGKFNAFDLGKIRMFVIGAMNKTYYTDAPNTFKHTLRNLQSTYWTGARTGALGIELVGLNPRVLLTPSRAQEAIGWYNNGGEDATYDVNGFVTQYKIKHWNDNGRTDPHLTFAPAITNLSDAIKIPTMGAIWGYFCFAVADTFDTAAQITVGNSQFRGVQHGRWTEGDLVQANKSIPLGGSGYTGILYNLTNPWGGGTTSTRLVRFGLHVIGRKSG